MKREATFKFDRTDDEVRESVSEMVRSMDRAGLDLVEGFIIDSGAWDPGARPLGTCDTQVGDEPHARCPDCVGWEEAK